MERDANGYYTGIINPYNGHNRKLVDAICDAWDEREKDFAPILYAFCLRDRAEISEKFNGFVPMTPEMALENADQIMEHICDDEDLECILKFLRVSEKKFVIKAEAVFSRDIEVKASTFEEAVEKAKAELEHNNFSETDKDGVQFY